MTLGKRQILRKEKEEYGVGKRLSIKKWCEEIFKVMKLFYILTVGFTKLQISMQNIQKYTKKGNKFSCM